MKWTQTTLGDFLRVRENRYKPTDKSIATLKRIDKIDFSGKIYLSDKASNTDMILIKKGDLVISGINVEKGAMSVYREDKDVVATIHYSSYEFDEEKIDIEFLTFFLRSAEFKNALKEQVPGGIKTEIKPKHLLPLMVAIPSTTDDQKQIVKILKRKNASVNLISSELNNQLSLLKKLRQQLLQDATQGKLVPQDKNDEPASELLKKIKAEKEKMISEKKIKKEKELPAIKEEEIPFEIPKGWAWCRLGEIALSLSTGPFGTMLHKSDYVIDGIPLINPMNIINERIVPSAKMMINAETRQRLKTYILREGDIVIGRRGEMGRCAVVGNKENGWLCGTGSFFLRLHTAIDRTFFIKVLNSNFVKSVLLGSAVGSTMNNLNNKILSSVIIPMPPPKEQKKIVEKLNTLFHFGELFEQDILNNMVLNNKLLQQILRESLRN